MKITIIILVLVTMTVAKHHHSSLRKNLDYDDFFSNINKDIHGLMEKIFDTINLNGNFSTEAKIKTLLTMHYDLSNIAEKNIEALKEIQNITIVNYGDLTRNKIALYNVVEKLLKEDFFDFHDQANGRKFIRKRKKSKAKLKKVMSEFRDSKEFMDFVVDFIAKVNNISLKDFRQSSKHRNRPVPFRRNLKVWQPPDEPKLSNTTNTRRVYEGISTQVKKYPFIVSIHIMGEFACAGSIISRDTIITAASCLQAANNNEFNKQNPKSIYVRLGSDYTVSDGETIPVQRLYFYPDYDPDILKHNLVMLRLEKRVRFSKQQNRIRRILWDTNPDSLSNVRDGILILGWGATKADQIVNKYQKLSLDVLDIYNWSECKSLYTDNYVTEENFCAGMTERNGGACNGDVGGPGIVGPVLMGIISFGAPVCGAVDSPTVFTKLGYYVDWISSILTPEPERRQSVALDSTRRKEHASHGKRAFHLRSAYKRARIRDDYPEEVSILREILNELILTNSSVVDDLLYGDLYDDFNYIFLSNEWTDDVNQHPLINKSLYAIPGVHYDTHSDYHTKRLTTSSTLSPMSSDDAEYSQPPIAVTTKKQHLSDILREPLVSEEDEERPKIERNVNTSNTSGKEYTDNYEESNDDNGMSIEIVTTAKSSHKKHTPSNKKKAYKTSKRVRKGKAKHKEHLKHEHQKRQKKHHSDTKKKSKKDKITHKKHSYKGNKKGSHAGGRKGSKKKKAVSTTKKPTSAEVQYLLEKEHQLLLAEANNKATKKQISVFNKQLKHLSKYEEPNKYVKLDENFEPERNEYSDKNEESDDNEESDNNEEFAKDVESDKKEESYEKVESDRREEIDEKVESDRREEIDGRGESANVQWGSEDYSMTTKRPFKGTRMSGEYVTFGIKVNGLGKQSKRKHIPKKTVLYSDSEENLASDNEDDKKPQNKSKFWQAFFNMKIIK